MRVLRALKCFLAPRQRLLDALQFLLRAQAIGVGALVIRVRPLEFGVRSLEISLRAFPVGVGAFEIRLRAGAFGPQGLVQFAPRLCDCCSGGLIRLESHPRRFGGYQSLGICASGGDLGVEPRAPAGTLFRQPGRPFLLGIRFDVAPRFLECLVVGVGQTAKVTFELGLQAGTDTVDDGTELILSHVMAIIGGWIHQVKHRKRRKLNPCSNLTPRSAARTMGVRLPVSPMRGRPRFDGDMVSQDALPRTITLVKQMETN
jgi:hypothetical protein